MHTDARWTLTFTKARPLANGKPGIAIAIPSFGDKSSVSLCWTFGFIRKCKVTDGARFDGRMLRDEHARQPRIARMSRPRANATGAHRDLLR